ncbi:hypothetical protein COEX109129_19195 [Corallococcus exiguus]
MKSTTPENAWKPRMPYSGFLGPPHTPMPMPPRSAPTPAMDAMRPSVEMSVKASTRGVISSTTRSMHSTATPVKAIRDKSPLRALMKLQPCFISVSSDPLPCWPSAETVGRGKRTISRVVTAMKKLQTSTVSTPTRPTLSMSAPAMMGERIWLAPLATSAMALARPRCCLGTMSVTVAKKAGQRKAPKHEPRETGR